MRSAQRLLLALVTIVILAGCASGPAPPPEIAVRAQTYSGEGSGPTVAQAMAAAKMDAVRQSVIQIIGEDAERAQQARLDEVLYSTPNPNAYVLTGTMETLAEEGTRAQGNFRYEIRIQVNVAAVERTLEVNGISANVGSQPSAVTPAGPTASRSADSERTSTIEAMNVTDQERQFIDRFVDRMTYMVYFTDEAIEGVSGAAEEGADGAFLMRSAVTQANTYLVETGHEAIDASQVERLKEDQRLVYEEQAGEQLSVLQWVARRLDADVYVELDARVNGRRGGSGNYATADVAMTMYDTSTGQILGSITRRSQEAFSRTSVADAASNALQSTVYQAMPYVVDASQNQMQLMLTRGIRYELTLQRPPDARTLSGFRTAMRDRVRDIRTVSQSQAEVLYEVFFVGSSDDFMDLVFSVSDTVDGFAEMELVLSRGRALTFDVGQ